MLRFEEDKDFNCPDYQSCKGRIANCNVLFLEGE
jgi:hypothetical protein